MEISVLIPAYNAEKTIVSAVYSALNQQFHSFEVLVYNDGSTDSTKALLDQMEDPRLKTFHHVENKGIVHARNTLVEASKGKYIAWLDADDLFLPNKLRNQWEFHEKNTDIGLSGTWAKVRNGEITHVKMPSSVEFISAFLPFKNPFIQSSIMVKSELIKIILFEKDFEYVEDWRFYLALWKLKVPMIILPFYGVSYLNSPLDMKYSSYNVINKKIACLKLVHPYDNLESSILNKLANNELKFGWTAFDMESMKHLCIQLTNKTYFIDYIKCLHFKLPLFPLLKLLAFHHFKILQSPVLPRYL